MLYKNKIKVQNILKSAVALMLMLTLSLSTALSPLAKAEEARYTWKTLTSAPASGATGLRKMYVTQDGSKLFIQEKDSSHNASLWMSADDGATWRKIFSKQIDLEDGSLSADGSKITLTSDDGQHLYISTDGGQNWTEKAMWATVSAHNTYVRVSPDGSFLAGCSPDTTITHNYAYATYISTDDGQTWTQKSTNYVGCPSYVANNGMLIAKNGGNIAKSTDYGQTWTKTPGALNVNGISSFSNNGNNVLDGDRISFDGGNHWTPSNAPIPSNSQIVDMDISEDGKKLFIATQDLTSAEGTLLTSVDGGRTWHVEYQNLGLYAVMSSDGSKLVYSYDDISSGVQATSYRVGTLPASQPVTPGSGAAGTVAPSSASTSATPGQKPGKASGRLAETGTSTWTVGGLAVVAVAAGALVLRKRL